MNLERKLSDIESIIYRVYQERKPPGLTFGLFDKQGLILEKSLGYANLETQLKVNKNTSFMVGSITKLLTVIAFMQNYEKGLIDLDDPVNNYLPKGKIVTKNAWPEVRFRHILTHTSGIGELRSIYDIFKKGFRLLTYDDEEIPPLNSFHELPVKPASPAGAKYAYSNVAVSILGYVIEQLNGISFRQYILENILQPLDMVRSDLIRTEVIKENEAIGYKLKTRNKYKRAKRWNNIIKPSGALLSSLNDMVKFGQMNLNKGKFGTNQILKPKTFELMWSPHYYAHDKIMERNSIGFIYRLHNLNGHFIVEHTGGVNGFNTAFVCLPENNLGFFTSCNLNEGMYNRTTLKLRNEILKLLTDISKEHPKTFPQPNKSHWSQIKGYYGGYPGFLTNTRIITAGIEFKITEKKEKLHFSGLIGKQKKGILLHSTEDPFVYIEYNKKDESIYYSTKYIFDTDDDGTVIGLSREFDRFRKLNLLQTFRFKIYLSITGIFAIIILAIIILLFI
jgi:CubicO group peptidase (beta-lactamase class C family)